MAPRLRRLQIGYLTSTDKNADAGAQEDPGDHKRWVRLSRLGHRPEREVEGDNTAANTRQATTRQGLARGGVVVHERTMRPIA